MAHRIWARVDGGVTITPRHPALTDAQWATQLAKLAAAAHLVGATTHDSPGDHVPPDGMGRRFRDAWRWNGSAVVHDVPTAKRLRMQELYHEARERSGEAPLNAAKRFAPGWHGLRGALDQELDRASRRLEQLTTVADIVAFTPAWPADIPENL